MELSRHYPRTWNSAYDKIETFHKKLKTVPKDKWFRISINGKNMVANIFYIHNDDIIISRNDMGVIAVIGYNNIDLVEFLGVDKHEN